MLKFAVICYEDEWKLELELIQQLVGALVRTDAVDALRQLYEGDPREHGGAEAAHWRGSTVVVVHSAGASVALARVA